MKNRFFCKPALVFSSFVPLLLFGSLRSGLGQGSLTPPGAPAATMKTLEQIEPRIDLQNAPASAVNTGNGAYHFIINQAGSYYLSGNLGVTKNNGIQINAEGVTLDLNGFEISRASGSGGNGIEIPNTRHRASVRNGSIRGFGNGVMSLNAGSEARGCSFQNLSVSGCISGGIIAGIGAVLDSCRASDNSGSAAISAGDGSSLTNCTVSNNTTTLGIDAGGGSSLINCSATDNTVTSAITSGSTGSSFTNCTASGNTADYGIRAGFGSSVTNCVAQFNTSAAAVSVGISVGSGSTITNSTSRSNSSTATSTSSTGMGFDLGLTSTITGCTASFNEGDGIKVISHCIVRGNTSASNGNGGDGAGIHATEDDNRIEGNNVVINDRGIDVDMAGNFISRNTASGNTLNWEVATGNAVLVINATLNGTAISGNSGGTAPGSTDPNANFTY